MIQIIKLDNSTKTVSFDDPVAADFCDLLPDGYPAVDIARLLEIMATNTEVGRFQISKLFDLCKNYDEEDMIVVAAMLEYSVDRSRTGKLDGIGFAVAISRAILMGPILRKLYCSDVNAIKETAIAHMSCFSENLQMKSVKPLRGLYDIPESPTSMAEMEPSSIAKMYEVSINRVVMGIQLESDFIQDSLSHYMWFTDNFHRMFTFVEIFREAGRFDRDFCDDLLSGKYPDALAVGSI